MRLRWSPYLRRPSSRSAEAVTHSPVEQLQSLVAPFLSAATCAINVRGCGRWHRQKAEDDCTCARHKALANRLEDVVAALANPLAHSREGIPRSQPATDRAVTITDAEIELARLQSAGENGIDSWSAYLPAFRAALKMRARVAEEACDAVSSYETSDGTSGVFGYRREGAGNRAQITRAENLGTGLRRVEDDRNLYLGEAGVAARDQAALYELRPRPVA